MPHCPCTGLISKAEHHDVKRRGIFRETVASGSSLVCFHLEMVESSFSPLMYCLFLPLPARLKLLPDS